MSEEAKPEVLPGDLITVPGVYMSRSNCAVEVRGYDYGCWKADWEDGVRWYHSSGVQAGLKVPNDPYQLVRWVGPLLEDIPTITSEQIAEIEGQAAEPEPQPQQAPQAESDFEVRIRVLKQCNDNQAETIGRLNGEIRDLRAELAEATQERYAQTARIGHLETINHTLTETIAGSNSEIHSLNMQIDGLQRELMSRDNRIGYLETLNSGQVAAIRAAGEQNTQLRELADNARRQLETSADEISELRRSLDDAEKQLDQKDAQIRDLRIELEAAQQAVQPLNDEQQELIWNEATKFAGQQVVGWLQPLVHALSQQPDERFLSFMALTLAALPNIVPRVLGYEEEEQGEVAEE